MKTVEDVLEIKAKDGEKEASKYVEAMQVLAKAIIALRKEVRLDHMIEDHKIANPILVDDIKRFEINQRVLFVNKERKILPGTIRQRGNGDKWRVEIDGVAKHVWADSKHLYAQVTK